MLLIWLVFGLGSLEGSVLANTCESCSAEERNFIPDYCTEPGRSVTIEMLRIQSGPLPINNNCPETYPVENSHPPCPVHVHTIVYNNQSYLPTEKSSAIDRMFVCEINGVCVTPQYPNMAMCSNYSLMCMPNGEVDDEGSICITSGMSKVSVSCCGGCMICLTVFVEVTSLSTTTSTNTHAPSHATSVSISISTSMQAPSGATAVSTREEISHSPSQLPTSGTNEVTSSRSSTVAIVCGVIGSVIVAILTTLLVLQLIRMFRRRKYHHHAISGTSEINSATLENTYYTQRQGEPSPYERAIVNGSGPQNIPLHPAQPSPYETATATTGAYSALHEKESSSQPGGATNNLNLYTTVQQHIYEDADRYVSSPESGIVNADYEVSLKTSTKSPQSADGDDYANPDAALFDEEKYETQPNHIKTAGGKKCGKVDRAPISTQYQPSDDNDYTIPDDAIFEEVTQPAENQESDEGVLNPLYYDLGKNVKWTESINDTSRTGVTKAKPVTIESTVYEPAVSAPVPATAHSELEPDSNTPVETENTSTHQEAHSSGSNASNMETQSSKEPHRRPEKEPPGQ